MTDTARLAPAAYEDLDTETQSFVAPRLEAAATRNILMTLARYPALLKRWMPITRYTFNENGLESSDSELICLRTSWLCNARYEFTQHAKIALGRGLSGQQIDATVVGPQASCFSDRQKAVLRAVDQLVAAKNIDDSLWVDLESHYDQKQIMDIVFS